jgi:DNA repair exonuclease SbcCD ATPase subunit
MERSEMTDSAKEEIKERLGNIDQIRHLLFGSKIQEYEQRFDSSDRRLNKLETELANFQTEIREKLTKLQDSLSSEIRSGINSLEKKLKYLSLTTHEETNRLQQALELTNRKFAQVTDSLDKKVNSQTSYLQNEVTQTRERLETEFQALKSEIFTELEAKSSDLKEGKVSREDLAEVLFELCLKIKGKEFVPSLKAADENHINTDFLLPEESDIFSEQNT